VLIDKSNNRESPFIFKKTKHSDIKTDCLNPLTVLGYCGIGGAGFTKSEGWGDTANCTYYPATKEQRDTLEKAMADAGYTFDFNKKELKKIEQKLSENVKPQSSTPMSYGKELEERMYEACNKFNAPNTDPNRYSAADLFYAGVKAERDLNTHAWSEEDERILVEMLKIFNIENFEGYNIGEYNEDTLKFLKSIKGRHTWKPSDEQMEGLLWVLENCAGREGASKMLSLANSIYDALKKLREE
jgi:hypothetical protein